MDQELRGRGRAILGKAGVGHDRAGKGHGALESVAFRKDGGTHRGGAGLDYAAQGDHGAGGAAGYNEVIRVYAHGIVYQPADCCENVLHAHVYGLLDLLCGIDDVEQVELHLLALEPQTVVHCYYAVAVVVKYLEPLLVVLVRAAANYEAAAECEDD